MSVFNRFLLTVAVVTVVVLPAAAQPTKPRVLDKDTFFQMESVSNPRISPDGSEIAFASTVSGGGYEIYRQRLRDGRAWRNSDHSSATPQEQNQED